MTIELLNNEIYRHPFSRAYAFLLLTMYYTRIRLFVTNCNRNIFLPSCICKQYNASTVKFINNFASLVQAYNMAILIRSFCFYFLSIDI